MTLTEKLEPFDPGYDPRDPKNDHKELCETYKSEFADEHKFSGLYKIVIDAQEDNDPASVLEVLPNADSAPTSDLAVYQAWGLMKTGRFDDAINSLNRATKLQQGQLDITAEYDLEEIDMMKFYAAEGRVYER